MHLRIGMKRLIGSLCTSLAVVLAGCGGGGAASTTLSCPTCTKAASASPSSSPTKPASSASAPIAAKAQPWPIPPAPQPVKGVLTGEALRLYVLNSARYMIAHPQLLDQTSTIAGITNAHGIRVDIYNWIQGLPMTAAQKAAMVQEAHATQDALLVDPTNAKALAAVDAEVGNAVNCLGDSLGSVFYDPGWTNAIDFMIANTPIRQKAYMAYNNAPSGPLGLPSGDTCKSY
ncbi:hypothetical protein [Thiomonas delicata]|uniref:Lipoprotein n=1 Tax=Thiomonas delicata TaxID=364030 RepID=A0A238D9Q8_THIDL|nr:hypothetical protein [Thiomonas delicata]SBP89989.1 exported hypothetical protein [Thiomonas delicata]